MGIRTCPRCSEPLHRGYEVCSHCTFSLADADTTFGSKRVRLQRIVDATKSITAENLEKLTARIMSFEATFPQLVFAAYIADLPATVNLRELGFWLINRAILDTHRGNENMILLCINNTEPSASLTLGYLPEQYLSEQHMHTSLQQAAPYLSARRYAQFTASCLSALSTELRHQHSATVT